MSTTAVITPVDLISAERIGPTNGPLSSADYNESQLEVLSDLASLAAFANQVVLPMLSVLSIVSQQPPQQPIGIQGSSIFGDTSDTSSLFLDPATGNPLVIADSLRVLSGMLSTYTSTLDDLSVQVQTLQQRISSSSLNDIALTLQNLSGSLDTLSSFVRSVQGQVTTLLNDWSGFQIIQMTTSAVSNGASVQVTVTWPVPFSDNSYSVVGLEMEESTADLAILGFKKNSGGISINVYVKNNDGSNPHTGTIHASARGNLAS